MVPETAALTGAFLIPLLVAGVCTVAVIAVLISLARGGRVLIDVPNPRSSHRVPRIRGGGIGVMFGLFAGVLIARGWGLPLGHEAIILLLGAALLAVMGLWDDARGLPAWLRLVAQLGIATAVAVSIGSFERLPLPVPLDLRLGGLGLPLTVLWLVGVTNFFNFMDGIDGLAGGQALASCAGVVIAGWSQDANRLSWVVAGAVLGFLVYNWPPAKVFLGDVGSMPLGFVLAGLPLLAHENDRSAAVLAAAVGLALFLFDPVWTLVRRARARKRIGEAHREHVYQRLLASGDPHGRVTVPLVVAAFALAVFGGYAYVEPSLRWPALGSAVVAFAVECRIARSAERRRAETFSRVEPGRQTLLP